MSETIARIRQANEARAKASEESRFRQEQGQSSALFQKAIFEAFNALADALQGDSSKAAALSHIFKVLEDFDGKLSTGKTELETLKAGMKTLEKELKAIPAGDLKQLPKFLQQREVIKVTNLNELDSGLAAIKEAVESLELHVEAPKVDVKAPIVHVPETVVNVPKTDFTPLQTALKDVIKAIKAAQLKLVDGGLETTPTNTMIQERFDEYRIQYDTFDESEDPLIEAIDYYYKKKKVARIEYAYNSEGHLTAAKKVLGQ